LPSVPTPVAPEITQARLDAKVDLNALFEWTEPFGSKKPF
jgi:hypothetical protein